MKNIFLFAFIACISVGCDKGGDDNQQQDSPSTIQITSPATGTLYINGGVLEIRGVVTDNNGLKSVKYEIKNSSGGTLYQTEILTGSVAYYAMNTDWTITGITAPTPCTFTVTAKDFNEKLISRTTNITLTD